MKTQPTPKMQLHRQQRVLTIKMQLHQQQRLRTIKMQRRFDLPLVEQQVPTMLTAVSFHRHCKRFFQISH